MENEQPEVIRDQMQETRTALTEKIEALEQKVSSTVETATTTVAETVETVKAAVQDTVGTVQETVADTVGTVKQTVAGAFDVPGHVERHPWAAMAGSVAVGFLVGRMVHAGDRRGSGVRSMAPLTHTEPQPQPQAHHQGANGSGQSESKPGLMQGLLGGFSGELDKLKDLGLGALMAVIRDMTTRSMPGEIGSRMQTWVNDLTEHMGVKPIKESLIPEQPDEPAPGPASQDMGEHRSSRPYEAAGQRR